MTQVQNKNTIIPTLGMTILLAALTAIQPLSTDMYLPSFLSLTTAFNTDIAHVQFTLSIFMIGFAIGQIFYGPFSDKYGRRPVLLVSLGIYMLGTVTCIFAPNIEMLILGRLLQAFGGSGSIVLGRTIVRDMLKGEAAGKMLATMGFILGFMPMIAPILGGFLENNFGRQSNFYIFLVYAIILILLVVYKLPETVPKKTTAKLTPSTFVKIYNGLLENAVYRYFILRMSLSYAGIFAFISGSSYYFQTHFELSPQQFSFAFAASVLGYLTGTLLGVRFITRFGIYKLIFIGALSQIVGGLLMFGLHISGTFHVAQLVVPMILYLIGAGIIMPHAMAGSMHDFPEKAGAASSLAGVIQVSTAALVGILVGTLIESYIIIMPLSIMLISVLNFIPCMLNRNQKL